MIKLIRAVRIHEKIDMPSGEVLEVDCNIEERLPEIINAYSVTVNYADKVKNDASYRDEFYDAYADFLTVMIGRKNWQTLLDEFDGHKRELIEAIAPWVNDTVTPAIAEASKRRLKQRMKQK